MRTAICTCIKNEHAYLREWLEYHLGLGFDHIYLYEDFGSESHADIVDEYDNVTLLSMEVVLCEEDHIEGRQMKSVRYSLRCFKEYDWIAFIDADEFIRLEDGLTLHAFLAGYEEHSAVYLSWRMFGACGHQTKPAGGVQESYTVPELDVDFGEFLGNRWLHKSIANMRRDPYAENIHTIRDGVNMDGEPVGRIGIYHTAWIDHYFTKSWEEWCDRIFKRGDLCNGNRRLLLFFKANPYLESDMEKMIAEVADRIPHGGKNYWLTPRCIAGGNVRTVTSLNSSMYRVFNPKG